MLGGTRTGRPSCGGVAAEGRSVGWSSELGPICSAIDGSFTGIATEAETLTKYAVRFRYPGSPYEPDTAETHEALQLATRVFEEVQRCLPPGLDESPDLLQS